MTHRKNWILTILGLVLYAAFGNAEIGTPSDNQIAEILKTANKAEIDAAKLAKDRAANSEVRSYAEHMIVEHTQNTKDEKELGKKIDVKPESSDIAKDLKKDAKNKYSELKKNRGSAFDKTYIDQQVALHQQLIKDLDEKLIPAAQNPQMKEFLQTTRTHVEDHLAKAQEIQTSLSK
jgi:putative membrane protein